MKVRVTILTENDRPLSDYHKAHKEIVEKTTKDAWQLVIDALAVRDGETGTVEKVEVIE